MINRIATWLALAVVLLITVLVVAGVGQGQPPKKLAISVADETREVQAVDAASPVVKQGEALFAAHGCSDCHTMAAGGYGGEIGPRLDVQSQGNSVHDVLANITDPPDDDKGYEPGLMPGDYGKRLSHTDLVALAEYIHAAASGAAGK